MSSVNQLNAQCKLLEIWKAKNLTDYPLKIGQQSVNHEGISTRADRMGRPIEIGKSNIVQRSCVNDAIRLWNLAPPNITESSSLYQAKKEIKKYARTLPVWEEKLNKLTNNNKERSLKWQKIKVKMQKTNNF